MPRRRSWLRGGVADLLLVACAGYSDRALLLLDAVARQAPDLNVMVLGHGSPNGFLGARSRPARTTSSCSRRRRSRSASRSTSSWPASRARTRRVGNDNSRIVCVLGPKGGTGKTLTSTNLAVASRSGARRSCSIDLDLQFGDVGLRLGLPPEKTVYDLAQSPARSTGTSSTRSWLTTRRASTLIAPRPARPGERRRAELLREIYSILRQNYDWVIVDTPPGFTAEVITSIDLSTDIVMVGMLDSLSLKNTKLGLETLELMKYDTESHRLVLNRAHEPRRDQPVGRRRRPRPQPDVFIPSDREIPRTVNEGMPIVVARPQSEPAEAFGRSPTCCAASSAAFPVVNKTQRRSR